VRSDACNIFRNNIVENGRWGIYIKGGSQFTIIENNDISRNGWAGVEFGHGKYCLIKNNTVDSNGVRGITLWLRSKNTTILGNIITKNEYGIYDTGDCKKNIITGNIISKNRYEGITIHYSSRVITDNIISHNWCHGIIVESSGNIISDNNISYNGLGLYLEDGQKNTIQNNNFIRNLIQCNFFMDYYSIIDYGDRYFRTNRWIGNYYNRLIDFFPKPIFGIIKINIFPLSFPIPYYIKIPSIIFDWHPVQEPYDIEV